MKTQSCLKGGGSLYTCLFNALLISLCAGTVVADETVADAAEVEVSPIAAAPIQVTALSYVRAKTALQFDNYVIRAVGKLNTLAHGRKVVDFDSCSSKRLKQDTLYSVAIVDINKGARIG